MNGADYLGKTIFFLFPDKVIEQMIFSLFKNEYEIYNLMPEKSIVRLFEKYDDSIIVINMTGKRRYQGQIISDLRNSPKTRHISVYAICDEEIRDALKNPITGCIRYDEDLENNLKKIFDEKNAIGRRKHLRLNCENREIKFNASTDDISIGGNIIDISSRAILCNFNDKALNIKPGFKFERITIDLNGSSVDIEGHIYKSVEGYNENLYVMMFNINEDDSDSIEAIKKFIFDSFQENMKKMLSEIG
jgi:hypothetical protein